MNGWLHFLCLTTRWREHPLSGFLDKTAVLPDGDPCIHWIDSTGWFYLTALPRFVLTSPSCLHSCTSFLVNSIMLLSTILGIAKINNLQIPNQEFLNYYKNLRGKNNFDFLSLISWTFPPNGMQLTTYIDLVICPWGIKRVSAVPQK